jgi:transcriptional regulator with XRE-family HTH domain
MHEDFVCQTPSVNTEFFWRWEGRIILHLALPLRILRQDAAIAERIRFYRRKANISIDILVQQADISRDSIIRYESGETEPDLNTLQNIADVLKIEVDKLFDDYFRFLAKPFGHEVKALRKANGLTQQEFGEVLGVHRKTVLRWEKGIKVVTRIMWQNFTSLFHHSPPKRL